MKPALLSLFAAATFLIAGTALAEPVVVSKSFTEEFDRLNPKLWYISDGWSNGSHQNCTWSKRALTLRPGEPMEVLYVPSGTWGEKAFCGEFQTQQWFKYGTFETRMRTDLGSGLNSAFFLYGGKVHGLPHGEIDFELLTKGDGHVWTNRYVNGDDLGEGKTVPFQGDIREFHDYAFIWEPDRLRWFIDGTLVREVTTHVPDHRLKVYFSHWGSDTLVNWMGAFEKPASPLTMAIEKFSYTPLGEDCAFPESVLCKLP